jgi:hypothetical protein
MSSGLMHCSKLHHPLIAHGHGKEEFAEILQCLVPEMQQKENDENE